MTLLSEISYHSSALGILYGIHDKLYINRAINAARKKPQELNKIDKKNIIEALVKSLYLNHYDKYSSLFKKSNKTFINQITADLYHIYIKTGLIDSINKTIIENTVRNFFKNKIEEIEEDVYFSFPRKILSLEEKRKREEKQSAEIAKKYNQKITLAGIESNQELIKECKKIYNKNTLKTKGAIGTIIILIDHIYNKNENHCVTKNEDNFSDFMQISDKEKEKITKEIHSIINNNFKVKDIDFLVEIILKKFPLINLLEQLKEAANARKTKKHKETAKK